MADFLELAYLVGGPYDGSSIPRNRLPPGKRLAVPGYWYRGWPGLTGFGNKSVALEQALYERVSRDRYEFVGDPDEPDTPFVVVEKGQV